MRHSITTILIYALLTACSPSLVPVVVPVQHPPHVDARKFPGIYFPGFISKNREVCLEFVRVLKHEFRVRGFNVLEFDTSCWEKVVPLHDFAGQNRLVITGALDLDPFETNGMQNRVREAFNEVGVRTSTVTRRWVSREGWTLTGGLLFLDHGKPVWAITKIRTTTAEDNGISRMTLPEAVLRFVDSDLGPAIYNTIMPRVTRTDRTFVR